MADWCKRCVYAEIDGADDPCFECEWGNDEAPTRFTAKRNKLTNADKYFRNATDEEIASFLAAVNNHRQWSEQTLMQDLDADYAYYLEWLKREVDERNV